MDIDHVVDEALDHAVEDVIEAVEHDIRHMVRTRVDAAVTAWAENWVLHHTAPPPPPSTAAVGYLFTITTGGNSVGTTFSVDGASGVADIQFVDQDNDKVEGPVDSVTGTPVVPSFTSDNPSVLTVATATEDSAQPGHWTAQLSDTGAGTANVAPAPLVNSDSTPVNETVGPNAGQPFETAAAIAVTVNPGAAAGEVFTVEGGS